MGFVRMCECSNFVFKMNKNKFFRPRSSLFLGGGGPREPTSSRPTRFGRGWVDPMSVRPLWGPFRGVPSKDTPDTVSGGITH